MLLQNLTKYYADKLIFAQINAAIGKGEHIGLVGANGVGKTTLLRILAGEESYEQGELITGQNYRIGYLKQMLVDMDVSLADYLRQSFADLLALQDQMQLLEQELSTVTIDTDPDRLEAKMQQYAKIREQWEAQGGYTYQAEINSIVLGLGLRIDDLDKPLAVLSGGQRIRAQLARLLLEKPDLLLLDEPSNHLDMTALEWLEDFLVGYPQAVIVVSHDRYFLDRVANKIWELAGQSLHQYRGNYTAYQNQRQQQREQKLRQAKKQQAEITKMQAFIDRFGAGTRASQAKSLAKRLDKMERIEVESEPEAVKIRFTPKRASGVKVVEFNHISKAFERVVLDQVSGEIRRGERVALIGPNGSGKSTLLKILAGNLDYTGEIKWGVNVDLGYFNQDLQLEHDGTVLDELYETFRLDYGQLRSVLARFLFKGDQVFQPVRILSGGERNRLILAKLFLAAPNFLLLDEPTNHLDIYAREALETALQEYEGTILFVTHDRYLIDLLATKLWILQNGRLTEFSGNYTQYREYLKLQQQSQAASNRPQSKKLNQPQPNRKRLLAQQQAVEEEIIRLEQQKSELEQHLADPELYQDPERSRAITEEYRQVEAALQDYYQQWEQLVEALEAGDDQ